MTTGVERFDAWCGRAVLALLLTLWVGATWLFSAWEIWWFWPFAGILFAATGLLALRLLTSAVLGADRLAFSRLIAPLLLAYLPFLIYALVRAIQADVFQDAERSLLLHVTPVMLAVTVMLGTTPPEQRRITDILGLNIALIGLYGIVNHFAFHNARVLWVPGFPDYQLGHYRATGTYFCPDHFAGLMELGLGLALAALLSRSAPLRTRLTAVGVAAITLAGIVLSKSRGAGAVTLALLTLALWLAPSRLPSIRRWLWRSGGMALLAGLVAVTILARGSYVQRFMEYPWRQITQSDRFQMSAAALRAWHEARVFGIGPGMHPNIWWHVAASGDGDIAKGVWPSHLNDTFHSYCVHDDWVQLLEEYGVVGVVLFLAAIGTATAALFTARRSQLRRWRDGSPEPEPEADRLVLGALFALFAMAIHSIGDFNLQLPATTWLLGGLVGLALAAAARDQQERGHRRRHDRSS